MLLSTRAGSLPTNNALPYLSHPIPYHITSHHITSHHITSHHTISYLFSHPKSYYFSNISSSSSLLSLLSLGGVGITLTAADVVIIYDSDWNPQVG